MRQSIHHSYIQISHVQQSIDIHHLNDLSHDELIHLALIVQL